MIAWAKHDSSQEKTTPRAPAGASDVVSRTILPKATRGRRGAFFSDHAGALPAGRRHAHGPALGPVRRRPVDSISRPGFQGLVLLLGDGRHGRSERSSDLYRRSKLLLVHENPRRRGSLH